MATAEEMHHGERDEDRERQRHRGNERQPPVAKKQQQDDDGEHAADENRVTHARNGVADELRKVIHLRDVKARGQRLGQLGDRFLDAGLDVDDVRADLLRHADARDVVTVAGHEPRAIGRPGKDASDVLHAQHSLGTDRQRRLCDCLDRRPQPRGQHELLHAPGRIPPHRRKLVLRLQLDRNIVHGQSGGDEPRWIGFNLDLATVARHHLDLSGAGDAGQTWTHDVEAVIEQVRGRHRPR